VLLAARPAEGVYEARAWHPRTAALAAAVHRLNYETAVAREPLAVPYIAEPLTKPLHADPRWRALLQRCTSDLLAAIAAAGDQKFI
jgi:hypothetical protein